MKLLAIIAARGGSKGVKNKNIRFLNGKPLMVYTIEQIIKWGKYDRFIISTDSREIADIGCKCGVDVPFIRPAALAGDTAGKLEVLRHGLTCAEQHYGTKFDILLDLDVTAPIRTIEDIENAVSLYNDKKADCVFSVVKSRKSPYFNMIELRPDGTAQPCKQTGHSILRRQDSPVVYSMNTSIYVYNRDFLLDEGNILPYAKKAYVYEMDELSAVDIDSELDFKYVEFLVKEGAIKI